MAELFGRSGRGEIGSVARHPVLGPVGQLALPAAVADLPALAAVALGSGLGAVSAGPVTASLHSPTISDTLCGDEQGDELSHSRYLSARWHTVTPGL